MLRNLVGRRKCNLHAGPWTRAKGAANGPDPPAFYHLSRDPGIARIAAIGDCGNLLRVTHRRRCQRLPDAVDALPDCPGGCGQDAARPFSLAPGSWRL